MALCRKLSLVAVLGSAKTNQSMGRPIKNDNMSDAEFEQFLVSAFSTWLGVIKLGAAVYICCSDTRGHQTPP